MNTLTTVSNSGNETLLTQIVPVFLRLRHNSLPIQSQRYEELLYQYANIINNESVETLRQSDEFFHQIMTHYEFDEGSIIMDIIEQFCNFLESRQYITNNPFGQSPTVNSSNPSISCQAPISPVLVINSVAPQNETKSPTNVLQFQRESTPNPVDIYLPKQTSTTSVSNIDMPNTLTLITPRLTKSLRELNSDFLNERAYVGKTKLQPNSISSYRSNLKIFATFLEDNTLTLNTDSIKKYLEYLEKCTRPIKQKNGSITKIVEKKLASETIMLRKYSLLSFLNYAVDNEWLTISNKYLVMLQSSKRDRTPEEPYIALTLTETEQLFNYTVNLDSFQEMLEVIIPLVSGVRAMEAVALKKKNFDLANYRLYLTITKNGLPRYIPIPTFMVEFLEQYLSNFDWEDNIFPSRQSLSMSRKTLTEHIKKIAVLAGLTRTVTCHDLRKTYATLEYYHGDRDLIKLQSHLGHRDINTTRDYVSSERKQDNILPLSEIYLNWEEALKTAKLNKGKTTN